MPQINIEGKYILDNNKLKSVNNNLVLHIRERKNISGNAKLFMAVHSPSFSYISNLYPSDTISGTTSVANYEELSFSDLSKWYLSLNDGHKYTISVNGTEAVIEPTKKGVKS